MFSSSFDSITLSCVPLDEQCTPAPYRTRQQQEKAYSECSRFVELIITKYGQPPTGARLVVKSQPYNNFYYYEVAVTFNSTIEEARDYAFVLEANMPTSWNDTTPIDWHNLIAT